MANFSNKYERLKDELERLKTGKMKVFGYSMLPILKSGSTLTFVVEDEYEVDDIVFSKVKGRYIDAHKITQKDPQKGYLISNNHGHDNGWTKVVYGRVSHAITGGNEKEFEQKKPKKAAVKHAFPSMLESATSIHDLLHSETGKRAYPGDTFEERVERYLKTSMLGNPEGRSMLRQTILEVKRKDYLRK